MSSNRTIIPGMESTFEGGQTQNTGFGNSPNMQGGGTCIPTGDTSQTGEPKYGQAPHKPIVGFLYSISKTNVGEFWPIYIGPNSIGRSPSCNISLKEGTVTENHATLVARMMKNPEKVIVAVIDERSSLGTMINGESLGFEPKECFNGDIITIGAHYELLLILIDAKQAGLKVCPEFVNIAANNPLNNPYNPPVNFNDRTRGFDENGFPAPDQNNLGNQGPTGGGRTIFM